MDLLICNEDDDAGVERWINETNTRLNFSDHDGRGDQAIETLYESIRWTYSVVGSIVCVDVYEVRWCTAVVHRLLCMLAFYTLLFEGECV